MASKFKLPSVSGARATLAFATLIGLYACASRPPAPEASLAAARLAISTAERTDAGHYAAGDLAEARSELASAEAAVAQKKMIQAEQLADQARVEAELAAARTSAIKAQTVNDEMQRSNSTLVEEIRRGEETK
jgi:hypothetical protein